MVSLFSLGPIGARHILALAAVPFTGALVRYRVDYRPKGGVALDDDDSVALGKGWVKSSYVEMLRRVHRLEVSDGHWTRPASNRCWIVLARDGQDFKRALVRIRALRSLSLRHC